MKSNEPTVEVFELFLLTKRANGVKPRTIETYKFYLHTILKRLDINQNISSVITRQTAFVKLNYDSANHPYSRFSHNN